MKSLKNYFVIFMVVAFIALFTGCELMDSLFYGVPKVNPADLSSVSGDYVSSESGALDGVMIGVDSIVTEGVSAGASLSSSKDFSKALELVEMSSPVLAKALNQADSRTVTFDTNLDGEDLEFPVTISLLIEDESEDVYPDGSVTLEYVQFDGKADSDYVSGESYATWISADFESEAKVLAENLEGTYNTENFTVESAKLTMKAKGNGKLTYDSGSPESADYYVALDMSLGFALSYDGYSGKYIINFKFVQSGSVDDIDDYEESVTGEIDTTVTVDVYDNDNKLLNSYEYDQEDMLGVLENT